MAEDMIEKPIPDKWRNGRAVSVNHRLLIGLLRSAGCQCAFPSIDTSNDDLRCRLCDTWFSPMAQGEQPVRSDMREKD